VLSILNNKKMTTHCQHGIEKMVKQTPEGQVFSDLIVNIFKLSGLLVAEGDRLTKGMGLTSARWKVLGALALSDKPMTVAQIARSMGQTRQGVQRIADVMAKEEIVHYQDNPHHKRAKLVLLTPKGKKIYSMLEEIQVPWANTVIADIDPKDMKTTLHVLHQIIQQLDL
jgi:DNA-binding MarR family transcriptional regulator